MKNFLLILILAALVTVNGCSSQEAKLATTTQAKTTEVQATNAEVEVEIDLNKEFISAVRMKKVDKIKELLEKGADVNSKDKIGNTALITVLSKPKVDLSVLDAILEGNPDFYIESKKLSGKTVAMLVSDPIILKKLINKGLDLNKPTSKNVYPLLSALNIPLKSEEFIKAMIEGGVDLNIKDEEGNSPLMISLNLNKMNLVELFLEANADLKSENKDGEIVGNEILMTSIEFNNIEIVKTLIKKGLDINFKDSYEASSLIFASKRNKKEIVEILLSAGADKNIKNDKGQTALEIAKAKGNMEIVEMLK